MRPFPDVVRIEPYGGNCNFGCLHCPTGQMGGRRGLMKYFVFTEIFHRLPKVPRVMVFYHSSEPLINREIEKMVAYAKHKGVGKTVLNTNAALIRPIPFLDEMRVSFDGTSPEENNHIRKGSDFNRDASKVKKLALEGQKIVIYNAQITGGEDAQPAQYLKDYFGDLVSYRVEPMRLWADQDRAPDEREIISNKIYPNFCSNLFETFTILSDGTVPKCCEDLQGDFLYGNALKETPLAIWERMEYIREKFEKRDYPDLCSKCWVVAGRFVK